MNTELKCSDYDFSASQDDSPVRAYKSHFPYKHRKTYRDGEEVREQNKENCSLSETNQQPQAVAVEHRVTQVKRTLEEKSMKSDDSTCNDYDFSSQDDSPVREYKSLFVSKHRKTDSESAAEKASDQNKENDQFAEANLQTQTSVNVVIRTLEEKNMNTESKCNDYDFSAWQDDSPVREYKPLFASKHRKTDSGAEESEANLPAQKLENIVTEDKRTLEEKHLFRRRVSYVYSEELIQRCNQMIKIPMRAEMVHSLVDAYGLTRLMSVISPTPASYDELTVFHDCEYIDFLKRISCVEDEEKYDEEAQQFGLSYDCPAHVGVYEYTALVCGATVQAGQSLIDGTADVAINWCGGWHHGKKDMASGFCYTNDVVLGILKLRQKFDKILYVDLDLHHGDGVEDAFCTTNKVLTVSVHKHAAGFFPGTGTINDIGYSKGKYHSINVSLRDGIRDPEFVVLMYRLLTKVNEQYKPEVVVCQCGADGITGDPMESFNLTPLGLGRCVQLMLSWKLPILLLGGGGYHHANTARCWTYLTGVILGRRLSSDIPDHKYLMEYGPDYELSINPGNMKDSNDKEYLQGIYRQLMDIMTHIS